jgi:hypothetical protein
LKKLPPPSLEEAPPPSPVPATTVVSGIVFGIPVNAVEFVVVACIKELVVLLGNSNLGIVGSFAYAVAICSENRTTFIPVGVGVFLGQLLSLKTFRFRLFPNLSSPSSL